MTISPGPTTASSVLNFADRDVRAPWSPSLIVPRAPRMSPTCASSSTAERPAPVTSTSTAVTGIHLFRAFTQAGASHTRAQRRIAGACQARYPDLSGYLVNTDG